MGATSLVNVGTFAVDVRRVEYCPSVIVSAPIQISEAVRTQIFVRIGGTKDAADGSKKQAPSYVGASPIS